MHYAAYKGNKQLIKYLKDKKADFTLKNNVIL